MHELPQDEWVVIFYPRTGSLRLCPTLDFARHTVSSQHSEKHIYKSPGDFRQRHDHHTLENFWRAVFKQASWHLPKTATGSLEQYGETPPDMDTESFVKRLWQFMQDIGDRLSTPSIKSDKSKSHYEFKLGLMDALSKNEEDFKEKYNNQARTVFMALLNNNEQFMDEDDIKNLILRLVADRKLKTKQKPWVIFQYYRPQFIKDGFVVRGRAPKIKH